MKSELKINRMKQNIIKSLILFVLLLAIACNNKTGNKVIVKVVNTLNKPRTDVLISLKLSDLKAKNANIDINNLIVEGSEILPTQIVNNDKDNHPEDRKCNSRVCSILEVF